VRARSPRRAGLGLRASGFGRRARVRDVRVNGPPKIRSNPYGNAASFCRFVLPLRICYGYQARNFGTHNRLGFWDAKNPRFLPINTHGCRIQKIRNAKRASRLSLPAAPPRTLLHPVRRRAPVLGRAGLRNLILSDPALGEGE
jgi:hypothetical protein